MEREIVSFSRRWPKVKSSDFYLEGSFGPGLQLQLLLNFVDDKVIGSLRESFPGADICRAEGQNNAVKFTYLGDKAEDCLTRLNCDSRVLSISAY